MTTRRAAILTADMEGFSGRLRADESEVIRLLVETYYRLSEECMQRFGGRLFRREGDAIWCCLDRPQQALDAGLWLLARMQVYNQGCPPSTQIHLRVGLAYGEVEGEPPQGDPLGEARRHENQGRVGHIHFSLQLLDSLQCPVPLERGSETVLVAPSRELLEACQSEACRQVVALDCRGLSPQSSRRQLGHLLQGQKGSWQFFAGAPGIYVLLGPPQLPLPEGLESSGLPLCRGLTQQIEPGLAAESVLRQLMGGGGAPQVGEGLGEDCAPPLELAQRLADNGAVILVGPWGTVEELEQLRQSLQARRGQPEDLDRLLEDPSLLRLSLEQMGQWQPLTWLERLGLPVWSWLDDPRLGRSRRALASPEEAFATLDDGAGELLWICPPHSLPWLRLLAADFDFRFPHRKPGTIVAWGDWEPREERRWVRRGFRWQSRPQEFFPALVQALRFQAQQRQEQRRLWPLPRAPYKFLQSYGPEDRVIFFGREEEVERLHKRLLSSWVVVVFGKSGVGKTSLLRSGVLAHFAPPVDLLMSARMLSEPVACLRQLVARSLGLDSPEALSLAELLQRAEASVTGQVVLVLDQFEEYFLHCDAPQRAQFGRALAEVEQLDLRRTHLVLSLREDFLAHMAELEEWVPQILRQRFRVLALDRSQALQAIRGPAELFGLPFDERVAEDLLTQLDCKGIEPPQLQIVLDRLSAAGSLTWDTYQSLGGAQTILRTYFEEALNHQLGPDRSRAQQVLKKMIHPHVQSKKVVTLDELQLGLDLPLESLSAVLKLLVESRLVRSWDDQGVGRYELAHDVLAREVASWESPEEVAAKHAQLVLRNEMRNYARLAMVVPLDRLRLLEENSRSLKLGPQESAMLIRSCVLQGLDPACWMNVPQSVEVLLQLLDQPISGEVARFVLSLLCRRALQGRELERTIRAAGEVGNPHLLADLPVDLAPALRRSLSQAVRQRFFGPHAMVWVAAGPARVGSSRADKERRKALVRPDLQERIESEADQHEIDLAGYWIDRYLVSNADYCEFRPLHRHFFPPEEASLPAVNVSCEEAAEYAAWLGKRLPSEFEWEKAARGSDGRLFPWGNEFDPALCNSAESGLRRLLPVRSFEEGASPYGCVGMVGNVWEWTSTPWEAGSPLMAKKGGCALNSEPLMHCSARFEDPPEMRLRWAGFRMVCDQTEEP